MSGPLSGYRIVEFAGIAPGPFAALLLADMGADVIRIDRFPAGPGGHGSDERDVLFRGRRSIGVDLKHPEGLAVTRDLVARADALIEGYRPGVMERLGLGPVDCHACNPRLVYGRITGWGQDGPLAHSAGKDINYISLAGVLHQIGRPDEPPVIPLNLVGDFAGGGMLLALGVLAGLLEASRSGHGQVVDAAMVDGSALLMAMFYGFRALGSYNGVRGTNLPDGGAHFYQVYETADGRYISVGSVEDKFYAELCRLTGFESDTPEAPHHHDEAMWPERRRRLAALFGTKTRDDWCRVLEGSDVCFSPVLSMDEAPDHPHNRARGTFQECGGIVQPSPAPRFSRTPSAIARPPALPGQHTDEILTTWLDLTEAEIAKLRSAGAVAAGGGHMAV